MKLIHSSLAEFTFPTIMKTTVLKKILSLIGLAMVALVVAVKSGYAQDLPLVGLLFDGRSRGDSRQSAVSLVGIQFTGECPGKLSASTRARFFSKSVRPAPELRAIVKNVTFGFASNQKPYTDREYFSGDVSESFVIRFGTQHQGRFLAVQPGENQFEYEIKRGQQSIESGTFAATFEEQTIEQTRNTTLVRRETKTCRKYEHKRCVKEVVREYYDRVCQS